MSTIDDELRSYVEGGAKAPAADASVPAHAVERPPLPPAPPRRAIGLLVGLLVMVGAILTLVFTSFDGSGVYSKTVDELLTDASWRGRSVRVQGVLVKGSLRHRAEPCEYRFQLHGKAAPLEVRFARCVIPDTFQDRPEADVSVTAEGSMQDGYFAATSVLAKCPSKYEDQASRPVGGAS